MAIKFQRSDTMLMTQRCEFEAALVNQFSGHPFFLKSFGAMQVDLGKNCMHGIQMEYFAHTAFKVRFDQLKYSSGSFWATAHFELTLWDVLFC
jgi:hypothetical protein